jgi:hypothetical protein
MRSDIRAILIMATMTNIPPHAATNAMIQPIGIIMCFSREPARQGQLLGLVIRHLGSAGLVSAANLIPACAAPACRADTMKKGVHKRLLWVTIHYVGMKAHLEKRLGADLWRLVALLEGFSFEGIIQVRVQPANIKNKAGG